MKKLVAAYAITLATAYFFDNTYQRIKLNRELKDHEAESAGQGVRNRLQGADVGPEDEMLSTPSIYRDWVRVQKGYQSIRMMNDNDNFDAESFGSEWHYFSECESKGCDGSIEYRDVYACPSCGQDDIEILIGDTCPDCGDVAEEVSKYAIFYCSDCEEDYTDMYNSEVQTNKVRTCSHCEKPKHPLYRGSGSLMGARQICRECNMKAMESSSPSFFGDRMLFDAESDCECGTCDKCHMLDSLFHEEITIDIKSKGGINEELSFVIAYMDRFQLGEMIDELKEVIKKAAKQIDRRNPSFNSESFGATVYRGKPMSELGYAERVIATKKMMEAADIEQSILQLEAAIRMGLISEDEIMTKLRDTFGPK